MTVRDWKDEKEDEARREEFRHAGSVARLVTGAVAGGRLAGMLRRDVRRRSISNYPPLSSPPPSPPDHTPSWNQQPTRRQATLPTSNSDLRSPLAPRGTYGGVFTASTVCLPNEDCDGRGYASLANAWEGGHEGGTSGHAAEVSDTQRCSKARLRDS